MALLKNKGAIATLVVATSTFILAFVNSGYTDLPLMAAQVLEIPVIPPTGTLPDLSQLAAQPGPAGQVGQGLLVFAGTIAVLKSGERVWNRFSG